MVADFTGKIENARRDYSISYIPGADIFDFINSVDLFVFMMTCNTRLKIGATVILHKDT